MEAFSVDITSRNESGSIAARRVRREGKIPAIVYHRKEDAVSASVDYNQFFNLASRAKSSQLFTLKSDDSKLNGRMALVKDIQRDYVSGKLLHVDFQALRDDEAISVEVPVNLIGESPGVKLSGGVINVLRHSVMVSCLPKDIPSFVEISISELNVGQSAHAEEIKLPQGVKLLGDADEPIVTITAAGAEEAPATPAGAEAAAPAAATPGTPEKK